MCCIGIYIASELHLSTFITVALHSPVRMKFDGFLEFTHSFTEGLVFSKLSDHITRSVRSNGVDAP